MTDVTEEDLENFEEKTEEEKINTLRTLYRKAAQNDGDHIEDFDLEGEMTVRVLDEDGEEKQIEKTDIKRGEI